MRENPLSFKLLEWYGRVRRELPWRKTRDPYRIWVSEIMLQQTRVDTVIPYYQRFMERFPDMDALAGASEDELMQAWQGLGYYSRARRLQQGVREVVANYGGEPPTNRDALLKLPGVGDYTAGAILSIAHEQPEPAIDGNVSRVISRLLHIDEPIERPGSRQRVAAAVKNLLEGSLRCGDMTQALMELGALVCLPRNPHCSECPWSSDCQALLCGNQESLPVKTAKKPPRPINVFTGILIAQEKVLAVRRLAAGLLGGMWEFPSVETPPASSDEVGLTALAERFRALGGNVAIGMQWRGFKHVFSHREWSLRVYFCEALDVDFSPRENVLWLERQALPKMIWAGPHRKISGWLASEPMCDWERGFKNRCQ